MTYNKELSFKKKVTQPKEVSSPLFVINPEGFINLLPTCNLTESLSKSPVLHLFLVNVKIFIVTSPLIIVFIIRGGSYWVMLILQFIRCLLPPNLMRMRKCRDHLQAIRGSGIYIHPSLCLSPSHLLYKEDFT